MQLERPLKTRPFVLVEYLYQIMSQISISTADLRERYLAGESSDKLAASLGVSKKTVLNRLQSLPDWDDVKREAHSKFLADKQKSRLFKGLCAKCGERFESKRRQKYCGSKCIKAKWRDSNLAKIKEAKKLRPSKAKPSISARVEWEQRFTEKLSLYHKRNVDKLVTKLLKRIDGVKNSMVSRSRKYSVECKVTIEELRWLAYNAYGTECKYSKRPLRLDNMVFDHIVPISKGGTSNIDNLQVISKFSNNMKGSLDEASFLMLLNWLETVPEDLRKDISIRLAHGIH